MENKNLFWLFFLVLIIVSLIKSYIYLDPDFGWHIRIGEMILKSGISITDPLSYTMPSYHFIDHEWLSNILIFIIYKFSGIWGLSIISTSLLVFSLVILIPKKYKEFSLIPLFLCSSILINFFGIRPLVISWVFMAIILNLFLENERFEKYKFIIPIIFLLWANLHGGFVLGIVILGIGVLFRVIINKKIQIEELFIVASSIIFTFINPYGIGIWHEILVSIFDSSLRFKIMEWLPGIFYIDLALILLVSLSLVLIFRYKAQIKLLNLILYGLFFLLAISSIRHIPFLVFISIPVISEGIFLLNYEVKQMNVNTRRLNSATTVAGFLVFALFLIEVFSALISAYYSSEKIGYPVGGVRFLNSQKIQGEILSIYNWGGYLDWKLPNKKVFIDGRMPSWRMKDASYNQSNNAMDEFSQIYLNSSNLDHAIKKYHISYILLSVDKPQNKLMERINQVRAVLSPIKVAKNQIGGKELEKMGFKAIYTDYNSTIYSRN